MKLCVHGVVARTVQQHWTLPGPCVTRLHNRFGGAHGTFARYLCVGATDILTEHGFFSLSTMHHNNNIVPWFIPTTLALTHAQRSILARVSKRPPSPYRSFWYSVPPRTRVARFVLVRLFSLVNVCLFPRTRTTSTASRLFYLRPFCSQAVRRPTDFLAGECLVRWVVVDNHVVAVGTRDVGSSGMMAQTPRHSHLDGRPAFGSRAVPSPHTNDDNDHARVLLFV